MKNMFNGCKLLKKENIKISKQGTKNIRKL